MRLQMRGTISPANPWDVMVDLFFYREPEETKDEEAPEDVAYPGADYNANAALPAPGAALGVV
jgi:small subunit ribosomal protein SAe